VNWEFFVIPLIALAVYILSAIFRSVEEAQEKQPGKDAEGAPLRTPRRKTSELERFLEEARQRRDGGKARQAPATARRSPAMRREVEMPAKPKPAEPIVTQPERPGGTLERLGQPAPRGAEPARPAAERPGGTLERLGQPAATPVVAQADLSVSAPSDNLVSVPPAVQQLQPTSPLLIKLSGLLRDRSSLATAVLLREILNSPPSARRLGGRHRF
jgi:hypothetical protein